MDIKKEALTLLAENINLKGISVGLLDNIIEKALDEVVARTDTPFDNAAKAALWPVLEEEVKKLIEKYLDLNDLLGLNESTN